MFHHFYIKAFDQRDPTLKNIHQYIIAVIYHEIISPTIQVLLLDIFHTSSQNTSFFLRTPFSIPSKFTENKHHHHLPGLKKSWLRLGFAAFQTKKWIPTFLTLTGGANECSMGMDFFRDFSGFWNVKNLFICREGGWDLVKTCRRFPAFLRCSFWT